MKLNYFVGEIVECRTAIGAYEGWREREIVEAIPDGTLSRQKILSHYRVLSPEGVRTLVNEPYMRRKSDSNDTDGTSIEEMMNDFREKADA